ncbi:hypothetical protein CAEBREN_15290 [Caenorhabditis brenneri]|uniref:Uncharacterized protein n=1 Tax=Caenorhabditis brenneri TaxID=135651 RepID=G0MHB1_CAEBE|nr:hypothetical protein CAEBREN_15290 [Caenorhabditis brenneri]
MDNMDQDNTKVDKHLDSRERTGYIDQVDRGSRGNSSHLFQFPFLCLLFALPCRSLAAFLSVEHCSFGIAMLLLATVAPKI